MHVKWFDLIQGRIVKTTVYFVQFKDICEDKNGGWGRILFFLISMKNINYEKFICFFLYITQ